MKQFFKLIFSVFKLLVVKTEKAVDAAGMLIDITHDWVGEGKAESDLAIAENRAERNKRLAAINS